MVNQAINLEAKTEDEPPSLRRIEGKELKIPDQGKTPDSNEKILKAVITSKKEEKAPDYEEISEAVEEAITSEEKEETLKDYVETENLKDYLETEQEEEREVEEEDIYAFDSEDEDGYETDYEQEEEQDNFFREDEFFEVEVDYWNLLLPDDPIEDFREYFPSIKENIFAKNGMPYYDGGMAKRMVKNLLAGE
jgi:hypothetical protein